MTSIGVMRFETLLYVLACVLIPAAWGWAMHRLVEWLVRRRAKRKLAEAPPEIDYSI